MKNISFFLLVIMISCQKKQDLEIIILNKEAHSLVNPNFTNEKTANSYDRLSLNIINYSLKNNSDKVYYIFFNDEGFKTMESYKDIKGNLVNNNQEGICFNIYKGDKLSTGSLYSSQITYNINNPTEYYLNPKNRYWIKEYYEKEVNKRKELLNNDEYIATRQNELITHGFILYPHQIKYFRTAINLPLRSASEGFCWKSNIEGGNQYQAEIVLNCNSKNIKKYLNADLKKEIEENNYVIFNGVISSNLIPVKIVNP